MNVATWSLSLALFVVAAGVAMYFFMECRRLRERVEVLRFDLREAAAELEQLRLVTAARPQVKNVPPTPPPRKKPISKKRIDLAVRELRQWVSEDGE